jgi:hypothetical protein
MLTYKRGINYDLLSISGCIFPLRCNFARCAPRFDVEPSGSAKHRHNTLSKKENSAPLRNFRFDGADLAR